MKTRVVLPLLLGVAGLIGFPLISNAGWVSSTGRALKDVGAAALEKIVSKLAKKELSASATALARIEKTAPELASALKAALKDKSDAHGAQILEWFRKARLEKELTGKSLVEIGKVVPQVVEFLGRNSHEGTVVLKKFGWYGAQQRSLTAPGMDDVVKQAGRLIDHRLDGSWVQLRQAMNKAELNGRDRGGLAEEIFVGRARAGRVPSLRDSTIFEAQHNKYHGLDVIALGKDGKIRIIEFGVGKKPVRAAGQDIGIQMDWPWVEKNLQAYLKNLTTDEKINLRQAGFPNNIILKPELATGKWLRDNISREIHAVEKDAGLLEKLPGVTFRCLEEFKGCATALREAS